MERQHGYRPPALDGPPLPPDGEHVWLWFLELAGARGSNGMGPNPISWQDVAAWVGLTGVIVHPGELEMILRIDRLWLADQAKTTT